MNSNPQSKENKQYFSSKLNELLRINHKKQIDLYRDLNIPKSTITGYVKGTSLPNRDKLIRLAKYFNTEVSELDLRFKDFDSDDLSYALERAKNCFGKPISDNDKKVIEEYLRHYFKL